MLSEKSMRTIKRELQKKSGLTIKELIRENYVTLWFP
jgi:hypothetical protein